MPMELATDLVSLALYDIVIFADDSGSMIFEEGGDRVDDLKLIVGRVAEVCTSGCIGNQQVVCRLCRSRGTAPAAGAPRRGSIKLPSGGCSSDWGLNHMTWWVVTPQVATLFDDDGIMVRFMNNMTEGNGIRDAASANALLQQVCSCRCSTLLHCSPRCGCGRATNSSGRA